MTGFGEALLADYPPAQAEVVRRVMVALTGRSRSRSRDGDGNGRGTE